MKEMRTGKAQLYSPSIFIQYNWIILIFFKSGLWMKKTYFNFSYFFAIFPTMNDGMCTLSNPLFFMVSTICHLNWLSDTFSVSISLNCWINIFWYLLSGNFCINRSRIRMLVLWIVYKGDLSKDDFEYTILHGMRASAATYSNNVLSCIPSSPNNVFWTAFYWYTICSHFGSMQCQKWTRRKWYEK